jgi:hypothetical protein
MMHYAQRYISCRRHRLQWHILNHTSRYWESLDPCSHTRLEFDLVQDMEWCQETIGTENEGHLGHPQQSTKDALVRGNLR